MIDKRNMATAMIPRRDANRDATRAAIVRVARTRFGRDGYDATGLAEVAAAARVTTGAIYHHFADKKSLFLAAAEQVEAELLATALAADAPDPWRRLRAAFVALIDACAAPDVQRIVFIDAPRVIGAAAWREVELRYAFGGFTDILGALTTAGVIRPYPVDLVAPVLLAALGEASRVVAADPGARPAAVDLLQRLLDALRTEAD